MKRIEPPAIVAFSGGRTSGLMLHQILMAHDGKLPDGVVPVLCNTGKEHEATLRFVRDCGERWNVPIRWVEWCDAELPSDRWREVTFDTASRNGEPFAALIRKKGFPPNPVARFCTIEMKIHATHRFARSALWFSGKYTKAVGLRADEAHRVERARRREGQGKDPWSLAFPLFDAGVTVRAVASFWAVSPFDLNLPIAPDGTTPAGNCDLCFLKSAGKIQSLIAAQPSRAEWWAAQERATNDVFRRDRQSYAGMADQRTFALDPDDHELDCAKSDCACTD